MKWNNHINRVTSKATNTLNFLRRNIYFCNVATKSTAYISLVRPILEYAAASWDPYTKQNINSIEAVQKRAARFAKNNYKSTTSVTQLKDELGWDPLEKRRQNIRLIQFYKSYNNLSPVTLEGLKRPVRTTRRSADGSNFIAIQARTDCYKYSFVPRTVVDWNSLSSSVRSKSSVDSFRAALQSSKRSMLV